MPTSEAGSGMGSSPSKRKGTAFESLVRDFLNSQGFEVERRALHGAADKGDLLGIRDWVLECKATKQIDLAGAVDEARAEAANARAAYYAVITKRRRQSVSRAYVTLELAHFTEILRRLESLTTAPDGAAAPLTRKTG